MQPTFALYSSILGRGGYPVVLGILVLTSQNAIYHLQGDGDFLHVKGAEGSRHYSSVTGWTKCLSSANIFCNYSSGDSKFS